MNTESLVRRYFSTFLSDDEAFVRYEAEPKSGAPFRNVEFIRLDGPKVRAVEVYFGPSKKKH